MTTVDWVSELAKWRPDLYSFASRSWTGVQVVGVAPEHWVRDTGTEPEQVIISAERLAGSGEDPFETARYLSSGYDCGAQAFGPDVGGHTEVRAVATETVLARYRAGEEVQS